MDVVSRSNWAGALSDRRHVVADGDGLDHDFADPGRDGYQAGLGYETVFWGGAGDCEYGGQARARRLGRISRHSTAVAVDAADDLWRSRSLRAELLVTDSGNVFYRGRRAQR